MQLHLQRASYLQTYDQTSAAAEIVLALMEQQDIQVPWQQPAAPSLSCVPLSLLFPCQVGLEQSEMEFHCQFMELTVDETAYVHSLAEFSNAKSAEKREYLFQKIEKMRFKESDFLLAEKHFELISRWYHLTILEMLSLKDFQNDSKWIAQRLGKTVTEEEIEKSILVLRKIGMLRETKHGKLERIYEQFNTTNNISSQAIRQFHIEMMERGRVALEQRPINERYFFSRTMPLDSKRLPEAEQLLIEFRTRFHKLMEGGKPDGVFHLSLQLYPVTKLEP